MVAILPPGRLVEPLDLRLQRVLLQERPAHLRLCELDAVFCVQLPGLSGLRLAHRHDWLLDGLRFCKEDLWRYQSGLSGKRGIKGRFALSATRCLTEPSSAKLTIQNSMEQASD